MALVSVKSRYQVVIPRDVREAVGVEVGDLLEANVEAGKITFTPKSAVDPGIAESLADFAAGRSFGPFKTDKELIESLHGKARGLGPKRRQNASRGVPSSGPQNSPPGRFNTTPV